jgi:hypothetical protein
MYFVVMPRVNLIVIFLTYHVYLYSINCPTVICLPSILFYLWRDTTSELWTPVLFPSYCYQLFTFPHYLLYCIPYCFPLDTLITFVSSKPVRLTTSSQVGNKVFVCVCAGSTLHKHHLQSFVSPLLIDIKPWFLNWGKTSCYNHQTFLLGFPTGWSFITHKDCLLHVSLAPAALFLAPLPGRKEDSARGVFAHTFFTMLLFYFTLFILSALLYIKNPKKLESLVVVFTCLLSFCWNGYSWKHQVVWLY